MSAVQVYLMYVLDRMDLNNKLAFLCVYINSRPTAADFQPGDEDQSKVAPYARRRRILEVDLAKVVGPCHQYLSLPLVNGGRLSARQGL